MSAPLRLAIFGLGVQGRKRARIAGADLAATIDPVASDADLRAIEDLDLDLIDAAAVCTPDHAKPELLQRLLAAGKHVLVEKPLMLGEDAAYQALARTAKATGAVLYTAYNHRFEPHFIRMRDLLASGALGRVYSLRIFYGNGTARLVADSPWRDRNSGVLPDLGSHLLDTLRFWFGDEARWDFKLVRASSFETKAFDNVVLAGAGAPDVELEMSLISWRNDFSADVFADKGSAHIRSLCKWGPSSFIHRTRILPSGRPTEAEVTLTQEDPTWSLEYAHFKDLCHSLSENRPEPLVDDLWIERELAKISGQAGTPL